MKTLTGIFNLLAFFGIFIYIPGTQFYRHYHSTGDVGEAATIFIIFGLIMVGLFLGIQSAIKFVPSVFRGVSGSVEHDYRGKVVFTCTPFVDKSKVVVVSHADDDVKKGDRIRLNDFDVIVDNVQKEENGSMSIMTERI